MAGTPVRTLINYLKSMCRWMCDGTEYAPPPLALQVVAIGGLMLVAVLVLGYSMVQVRRMEINSTMDRTSWYPTVEGFKNANDSTSSN